MAKMSFADRSTSTVTRATGAARRWVRSIAIGPAFPYSKKPAELVYGVDDTPPFHVTVLTALQHVGLVTIQLIYSLLLIDSAGLSASSSANMLALAMMALGVAALLQVIRAGPIGSGFLCPSCHAAIFLAPSLIAVKIGGLPLAFGMTVFAGVLESSLSPVLRRIRPLLPPEIGGLVVFFVGTSVAAIGCRFVIGAGSNQAISGSYWLVAAITLATTVSLNVWAKGQARLFCAMIGMTAGYIAATAFGILSAKDLGTFAELPVIAFPTFSHISWSWSISMIVPFTIAALAVTVKTVGDVTVCQRVNDNDWVRPDMTSISRGVLANGLANIFSGLVGTLGLNTATASIGLQSATGVTSRVIGFFVAGILIVFAFLPRLTGIFIIMPHAVMGASLLFSACFILISGLQTITSRMLDSRRTLVIGLALSSGVAAEVIPGLATNLPPFLEPIVGSSLVFGTTTALLLNGLFRLGQRKRVALTLDPAADVTVQVEEFFNAAGRRWGARRDVMVRVIFGVNQAIETIREYCGPLGALVLEASFDEFNLEVKITYAGVLLELSDRRPSNKEIIETEAGHRRLAGFLIRRNADLVSAFEKDGLCAVQFHFDH